MSDNDSSRNELYYAILTALSSLIVFASLYIFRQIDNNRLTSWKWAFAGVDLSFISVLLIIGIGIAYMLSRLSFLERYPRISLMMFSYLVCVPFWGEPEVVVDASRYFTQAKHLKVYGIQYFLSEWGHDIHAWTDLPLLPFIYGVIFKFFGENRVGIQLFNSLLFSATLLLTFLIGKTLWNEALGFSAGILLLGIPYLLTQPALMLVDIATMCFLAFALYTFIMALKKGGAWICTATVSVFLAFFSKFSTWMFLSVIGVAFLYYLSTPSELVLSHNNLDIKSGSRLRCIRSVSFIALLSSVLIGLVLILKYEVIKDQIHLLLTFQKPALKGWRESFVSTFLYQTHPFITCAALCSVYIAWKKRDPKLLIIGWPVLIIILLQIKRIRYMLPIFPMITLMAAYGFQAIKNKELKRFAVMSAVMLSLVVAVFVYLPFLQRISSANLMHAGKYLDSLDSSFVEVLTLPPETFSINPSVSVPILDFFTQKDIYYDYKKIVPPEEVKQLPLRFTWVYDNPEYYRTPAGNNRGRTTPLVLITSYPDEAVPSFIKERITGFSKSTQFDVSTGFFRYSPTVTVYEP